MTYWSEDPSACEHCGYELRAHVPRTWGTDCVHLYAVTTYALDDAHGSLYAVPTRMYLAASADDALAYARTQDAPRPGLYGCGLASPTDRDHLHWSNCLHCTSPGHIGWQCGGSLPGEARRWGVPT